MEILKKIPEGEKLPPFHHIAYKNPTLRGYTTAPIPFIPFIRLYRSLLFHIKPSIYDKYLHAEYKRGHAEGYRLGYSKSRDIYMDIATRPTLTIDHKALKQNIRNLCSEFKALKEEIKKR